MSNILTGNSIDLSNPRTKRALERRQQLLTKIDNNFNSAEHGEEKVEIVKKDVSNVFSHILNQKVEAGVLNKVSSMLNKDSTQTEKRSNSFG